MGDMTSQLREALSLSWTQFLDANPDDLNSPEDLPDHALMTGEQFEQWAMDAILSALPAVVSDDDIIVLYQEGRKLDDIAQAVGLPKSTVHARLKKHGLTSARRGKIEWTHKMRCDLIGLRAIKAPVATIAKRLKVSRSAIYAELARMGTS